MTKREIRDDKERTDMTQRAGIMKKKRSCEMTITMTWGCEGMRKSKSCNDTWSVEKSDVKRGSNSGDTRMTRVIGKAGVR